MLAAAISKVFLLLSLDVHVVSEVQGEDGTCMLWRPGATAHFSSPLPTALLLLCVPGLSTQQLLLSSVCCWVWALRGAGAELGMYALRHLRAGHGGGVLALSWECHGSFRGHFGQASFSPTTGPGTEPFECEISVLASCPSAVGLSSWEGEINVKQQP